MPAALAINARFLGRRPTGVERYARTLADTFGEKNMRLLQPRRPVKSLWGHLWEQMVLPRRLRTDELLWSPANTGPLAVRRQVLTLHDASTLDHPEWFTPIFAAWYRWLLPRLARRVQRVITVSAFSRQRLLERLHLPEESIVQISEAVDACQFYPLPPAAVAHTRQRWGLPERYLLFVGTLEPRKNIPLLLNAWQQVRAASASETPLSLVIAGSASPVFRTLTLPQDAPGVHWLGYVPETELAALYSGALACILPSLYEGFGLPALEAMACGTPVIISRAGGLPEVAGEAGLYIDPLDAASLAAAMQQIIGDASLRHELSQCCLERARFFTWERTAQATWQVLQGAME